MAKDDDTRSSVDHIWNSAPIIPGLDPTLWRLSPCGLPIAYYSSQVTTITARKGREVAGARTADARWASHAESERVVIREATEAVEKFLRRDGLLVE
jgi:hypothetical protein